MPFTTPFLDDRPVSLSRDILWGQENPLRRQIARIAQTITLPLVELDSGTSITFAVFGRWGMGKSSTLNMLIDQVKAFAKENVGDEAGARIKVSHFSSPIYEAEFASKSAPRSALQSLIQGLIESILDGEKADATYWIMEQIPNANIEAMAVLGEGKVTETNEFRVMKLALERWVQSAMRSTWLIGRVISDFLQGQRKDGNKVDSQVCIVLIDDLDRCGDEFVWQVLNAVQQLSNINNVFFIMAVDPDKLRKTVQQQSLIQIEVDPEQNDFALEKYVQHSINIPEMSLDGLRKFMEGLSSALQDDSIRALNDNPNLVYHGLRVRTPRSVKRLINAIRLEVQEYLKQEPLPSSTETSLFIKKRILEYSWPDFYKIYYVPAERGEELGSAAYLGFTSLESACEQFTNDQNEYRLRFELGQIPGNAFGSISRGLATYLGQKPSFFGSEARSVPVPKGNPLDSVLNSQQQSNLVQAMDISNHFDRLYYELESAQALRNRTEVQRLSDRIIQFVQGNENYFKQNPRSVASRLGDIGGYLAQIPDVIRSANAFELAFEYPTAVDNHYVNNVLRYCALIVVNEVQPLYPRFQELLATLDDPRYASMERNRVEQLRAGFMLIVAKQGGSAANPQIEAQMQKRLHQFEANPTDQTQFATLMAYYASIRNYAGTRTVAKIRYAITNEPDAAYTVLRLLADGVNASTDAAEEMEALELYRFILRHVLCRSPEAVDDEADILYNYGVNLYKYDWDDAAGEAWFRAYKLKPEDEQIRRAYARYLSHARRPDLALKASQGEPLDIETPILIPTQKQLPERFVPDDYDIWWIHKPLFADPCP